VLDELDSWRTDGERMPEARLETGAGRPARCRPAVFGDNNNGLIQAAFFLVLAMGCVVFLDLLFRRELIALGEDAVLSRDS
jgi:hypothetical protein